MIRADERRDLVKKLDAARAELLGSLDQLPEQQLTTPWKEGDRTPKGQLLHLIVTEQMYRDSWARRARDENEPNLTPESMNQVVTSMFQEGNQLAVAELLQRLEAERQQTLRFIAETADEELERKGLNTPFGDMTVIQFMRSLYRHDLMHVDELTQQESRYNVVTKDGRKL
jgi:hypothetical protein